MDVGRLEKVDLIAEKWGGAPHYAGHVYVLGDDRHGKPFASRRPGRAGFHDHDG
jgi:hypothetical protein